MRGKRSKTSFHRAKSSRVNRSGTRDTLELERVYLSEACLPLVEKQETIEVLSKPEPLHFDAEGNILSPFKRK